MKHGTSSWIVAAVISVALMGFAAPQARAQLTFTLTGVSADAYPTMKVSFDAKDRNNLHIDTFSPSDFTVVEDGVTRPVLTVSCPPPVTPPMSVTLAVDNSISMSYGGRMDNLKAGALQFVKALAYPPAQMGLTVFDEHSHIYQPYSADTATLGAAINNIPWSNSGTDFFNAFMDVDSGAIDFTKFRAGDRYLIFLTDGNNVLLPAQVTDIVNAAKAYGLHIYTMMFTSLQPNYRLRDIATGTGGLWFESITTKQQALDAFNQITARIYTYPPCELTYLTTGCETSRNLDVTLRKNGYTVMRSTSVQIDPARIVSLTASRISVDVGTVPAGGSAVGTVTLTAVNGPLQVQSITPSNPAWRITSYGGSSPPIWFNAGESRTLTLQYTAADTNRTVAALTLQTTAPCWQPVVLVAGSFHPDALQLLAPNGGEVLYAGSNFPWRWRGVPANTRCALDYSTDAGDTWRNISASAYSLTTPWTVANTPSTTCLGIVRTNAGRNSARDGMWMPYQPSDVTDVALAPSGTLLAAALADGRIKLYHIESGALLDILPGHATRANAVAFSPDETMLASAGSDGRVRVWDCATGGQRYDLGGLAGAVHSVVFSSDGGYLAAADASSVIVWNTATMGVAWSRPGASMSDGAIAIQGRNAWVASAIGGNLIAILDMADGATMRTLSGHAGPVRAISTTSDGRQLASGSDDRTIRVWNTLTWMNTQTLSGHTGPVTSVNLSGAGLSLLSSSRDRTVKIWDVRDGILLQNFTNSTNEVAAARFEQRAGLIASGGLDRALRVWGYAMPLADESDSLWSIIAPVTTLQTNAPAFAPLLCPGESSSDTLRMANQGNQPITLTGAVVTGTGASAFALDGWSIPPGRTLAPGDSAQFPIRFFPAVAGTYDAVLEITTDAASIPRIDIPLSGHKDSAAVVTAPDTLFAGESYVCTLPVRLPFTITNTGTVPATVDSLACAGGAAVALNGQFPRQLLPGAIDTVWVELQPAAFLPYTGLLSLGTMPCTTTNAVAYAGAHVSATPTASPDTVRFGFTSVDDTSSQTCIVRNGTGSAMRVTALAAAPPVFSLVSPSSFPFDIPPHDSVIVTLAFTPTSEGVFAGLLACQVDAPCADSVVLPLAGDAARKPAIDFAGGQFRTLLCPDDRSADSTITLSNLGGQPLDITGMTIGGLNPGDFSLRSSPTMTIQPGGTGSVVVRFSPKGPGDRSATLTVTSNAVQMPTLVIALTGRKDSAGYAVSPAALDYATLFHCELPARLTATFVNTGTVDLRIAADRSGLPAAFVIDPAAFPLPLPAGDTARVDVLFDPAAAALYGGTLRLQSDVCPAPATVTCNARFAPTLPSTQPALLAFDTVGAGRSADRSWRIVNPGPAVLRLRDAVLGAGDPWLARTAPASFPVTMQPGDTVTVTYHYAPDSTDHYASVLTLVIDRPCDDTVRVPVTADAVVSTATVALPDITAAVGEHITIPLILEQSAYLAFTGTRSFRAELRADRSMLWPEGIRSSAGAASFTKAEAGDTLVVTVQVDQAAAPANGTLAMLDCLVLLGDSDVTPLGLGGWQWLVGDARTTLRGGSLTVTGICRAGGPRFMAMPGALALLPNVPNPFNPSTTVTFSLPGDMAVDLRVYNGVGAEAAVLATGPFAKGVHSLRFDAADLPAGVYHCVLRTPAGSATRPMLLIK